MYKTININLYIMGKNDKKKRIKKTTLYRTKEERKEEVKKIIKQLSHFELTIIYEPIKQLYALFKKYIDEGNKLEINIPFPMISRRIKGLLAINVNENVYVKLQQEKF